MLFAIRIATLFLIAVNMSMALAHALEFPGKRRLDKNSYLAAQTIYYPGFTIAGSAEPLSAVATLVLFFMVRGNREASSLTLLSFLALVSMHVIFWAVTQPVNKFWLKAQQLTSLGRRFFSADANPAALQADNELQDWRRMRDRWEYSHLVRALLSLIAFIAISASVVRYS